MHLPANISFKPLQVMLRNRVRLKALLLLLLFISPMLEEAVHRHACTQAGDTVVYGGKDIKRVHLPYQSCNLCDLIGQQVHHPYIAPADILAAQQTPVKAGYYERHEMILAAAAAAYANKGPPRPSSFPVPTFIMYLLLH